MWATASEPCRAECWLSSLELAAESAVDQDEPFVITDLDARYLNRVKVGPVEAVAELLIDRPPRRTFVVHIRDTGEGRVVTYVTASGTTSW